ncbi:MAG: dihydroorotate dehydrogenase-like protein [Candidatus Sabulitectum sp.]|nr:dihydroorotate dehydrogenase-like protein [Candidatus Sabulitectum sp.]
MNLSTVYMSLNLRNPIIVGSCGLTGTAEKVKACADAGAGAVVLKSIFEEQIESELGSMTNESNWYPEAADYINSYGMQNAVSNYLELLEKSRNSTEIPIIPSIHCFGKGNWMEFAKQLENAGASALELNTFILPSDPRRTGRENENTILDIVSDIKSQVSIPVAVKIGSYFSSISAFASELDGCGVDSIVLFNRFFRIDFDIENLEVVNGSMLSTPDETEDILRWVSMISPVTNCDIAATTGIHDGEAVVKQLLAGANAVQICSILYKNGLGVIAEMHGFIADWMRRHNYNSIEDFRERLSQRNSGNPAEFQRVQFMKASVKA